MGRMAVAMQRGTGFNEVFSTFAIYHTCIGLPSGTLLGYELPSLGDSRKHCIDILPYNSVSVSEVLSTQPFKQRLSFLDGRRLYMWRVSKSESLNHGSIYVGVFDEDDKLVDLYSLWNGTRLAPIVKGEYASKLRALTEKMEIEYVFSILGPIQPIRYYRDASGRWMIDFVYPGYAHDLWKISVIAGEGIVSTVKNVGI